MEVIIVGDNKKEISILTERLSEIPSVALVKSKHTVDDALLLHLKHPDAIFFLASNLLGNDASDLFAQLDTLNPVIVYGAQENQAFQAFQEGAVDYILLSADVKRFVVALKKAALLLQKSSAVNDTQPIIKDMYVRSNSKSLRVPFSEVLYIEAMADYVIIHTETFKYIVHYTMKGIQDHLPKEWFVRVHRSYIVNIDKIFAIDNQEIIIKDKRIPIGGSNKEYFYSRINII